MFSISDCIFGERCSLRPDGFVTFPKVQISTSFVNAKYVRGHSLGTTKLLGMCTVCNKKNIVYVVIESKSELDKITDFC